MRTDSSQPAAEPVLGYSDQPLHGRVLMTREVDAVTVEMPPRGLLREAVSMLPVFVAMVVLLPLALMAWFLVDPTLASQFPWGRMLLKGLVPLALAAATCLLVAAIVGAARTTIRITREEVELDQSLFGVHRRTRWPKSAVIEVRYAFGRLHVRTARGYRDGWVQRSDKPALRWMAQFLQRELG